MTSAVLNDKCEKVGVKSFVSVIDNDERLEVFDSELTDDGDSLIIRDTAINEGTEGAFIRVSIDEVSTIPASQIISCIKNERNPIVCHGVTRIVGYYSRTHNWNNSKIGELRDRSQFHYTLGNTAPEHDEARHKTINKLG